MGFDGKGIIYRALKNSIMYEDYEEAAITVEDGKDLDDYNWICGYPDSLPFEDGSFDTVVAFFSLSYINRKYIRNKTVREIHRVLKKNGKLYIWDINIGFLKFCLKRKLKVILPHNETVESEINANGRIGNYNMFSLIPVIKRYFDICEKKSFNTHFQIEAAKKDDNN